MAVAVGAITVLYCCWWQVTLTNCVVPLAFCPTHCPVILTCSSVYSATCLLSSTIVLCLHRLRLFITFGKCTVEDSRRVAWGTQDSRRVALDSAQDSRHMVRGSEWVVQPGQCTGQEASGMSHNSAENLIHRPNTEKATNTFKLNFQFNCPLQTLPTPIMQNPRKKSCSRCWKARKHLVPYVLFRVDVASEFFWKHYVNVQNVFWCYFKSTKKLLNC